jgi:hypothetical protein
MRIERDVANRKISDLEEIPEEFRDEFKHFFDGSEQNERPRDTEAIRIDLGDLIEELDYCLDGVEYFTDYLPPGRKKSSPQLDALREKVDGLWDDFKVAAKALAYHF